MSSHVAEAVRASLCGVAVGASLLAVPASAAGDTRSRTPLPARVSALVSQVERAALAARSGDPDAVQAQYDAARDLEEAVRPISRVSPPCGALRREALALARAHVMQAEGFDMQRPDISAAGRRQAAGAKRRLDLELGRCRADSRPPGSDVGATSDPLLEPGTGQAVFGRSVRVRAMVPAGAHVATIAVDSSGEACMTSTGGARRYEVVPKTTFETALTLTIGRHDVVVAFCADERRGRTPVATRTADRVWVLPASAQVARLPRPADKALSRRLASASSGFSGYSAVWFQDLRSGRVAGWNTEARFPAASTVKIGVLVAALRVLGAHPERSRFAYDLETMIAWSSNLATNRLLRRIGHGSTDTGSRAADRALKQVGARSSTFTGEYRVGTSVARPNAQPPLVSSRVTTARDLGRLLFQIHAGATGSRAALAALRLDEQRARLALGLLASSEPVGDNVGLVRGSVPPGVPIAQKNGWLRDARHTGAIVYYPRGPELIVVLTYRPGLSLGATSAYSGNVMEVLRRARNA